MKRKCQHCRRKNACRPRRLCWGCYYTPGIPERYPASKFGRHAHEPTEQEVKAMLEEARAKGLLVCGPRDLS